MSLCLFASALVLVCSAIGFGQTAGFEEQRRVLFQRRLEGHLREALETARKMVAEAERHEPSAAPLPLALHDYAVISGDLSLFAEAERALRRAIRLLEIEPPRDESVIQLFRFRLADVYLDAGRLKEAAALYDELRRSWEQTQPASANLAMVLDHLAWIEVLRKNFAAAETLLQRSIRLLEARDDVTPWRMAEVLNDYASMLLSLKRYADAANYAERVQPLFDRQGVAPNSTLINTWMLLGAAYAYTGRMEEAGTYVRRSISASQTIFVDDRLRAGRLMAIGAVILRRCGQKAEAKSLRKTADQIMANAGREDPGRFTIDVNALR